MIVDNSETLRETLRVTQKGIEKYFTPARGYPLNASPFYKYFTHAVGWQ